MTGIAHVDGTYVIFEFRVPLAIAPTSKARSAILSAMASASTVAESTPPSPPDAGRVADISHSADFSSVNWYGRLFTFSPKQRLVVERLFLARARGYHFVGNAELLAAAESDGSRIYFLFRHHPAWGTMIQPGNIHGGVQGTYRLAPAPTS